MSDIVSSWIPRYAFLCKILEGGKGSVEVTFPISPEDIYPRSTISNLSFINLLIEYHSKCPIKATSRNEVTSRFYLTWKLISTYTHLRLQSSKPRRGLEEEANKSFSYRSKFSRRAFTQFPLPLWTHFHGGGLLISEHCLDCSPRRWIVHLGGGSVSQDILIFLWTHQTPVS